MLDGKLVFITGASSGIGAACARACARQHARLLLAARRSDRLKQAEAGLRDLGAAEVHSLGLDVRDEETVFRKVKGLPDDWQVVDVLINNAGLSRGLEPLQQGRTDDWNEMLDTNVKGLLYIDRAVVPLMVARSTGSVVHIGSVAGRQVYPGGNVYCASKHAVRALTDALRIDLAGTGVRVLSIDPGMVDTEFSLVRFHGDADRARAVYDGVVPLTADDVADAVLYAVTRPAHVNIAELLILPTDQASATVVHRRRGDDG